MSKKILVDAIYPQESRVVVINKENQISNFDYDSATKDLLKGNVYLGTVTRVEPSLQAAFVEYSNGKHGFLPFAEIHPDYYQIPAADKVQLKKEVFSDEETNSKVTSKGKSVKNSRSKKFSNNDREAEYDEEGLEAKKHLLTKKYKIQEVIKKGQLILVQVIKEERGNKGVSLSTYLSLAGRYCVLMPNSTGKSGGVSRKIADQEERKRLKNLLKSLNMPSNTSLILRTAVAQADDEDIRKDYEYLAGLWNNIRKSTLSASAPELVHQEADIIKRVLRDYYCKDISEIVVEGEAACNQLKKLAKSFLPDAVKKIRQYKSKTAIFEYYRIEEKIAEFYSPIAELPSGGYIVINITEALVSIDINSGRATKERSVEETALKTNVEAAREVARQARLRDLSGLIVIDFIDMLELENRKAVERELRMAVEDDKARIQIGRISTFGLLELSRQRLKPSLIEANTTPCPHCRGNGYLKSFEAKTIDILKAVRREVQQRPVEVVRVFTTAEIVADFFNFRKKEIYSIEEQFKTKVFLKVDNNLTSNEYSIQSDASLSEEEKSLLSNDRAIDFAIGKSVKSKASGDKNFVKMFLGKLKA